jgi:hypothetical protein
LILLPAPLVPSLTIFLVAEAEAPDGLAVVAGEGQAGTTKLILAELVEPQAIQLLIKRRAR